MLSIAYYIAVEKKILSQKPKEFLYVSFLKNTFRKDTYKNSQVYVKFVRLFTGLDRKNVQKTELNRKKLYLRNHNS